MQRRVRNRKGREKLIAEADYIPASFFGPVYRLIKSQYFRLVLVYKPRCHVVIRRSDCYIIGNIPLTCMIPLPWSIPHIHIGASSKMSIKHVLLNCCSCNSAYSIDEVIQAARNLIFEQISLE